MQYDEIVKVMSESVGQRVKCIEKDGEEWTGVVDIYESAFENEDDEKTGDSICARRDDGQNVLVYADEIRSYSIMK